MNGKYRSPERLERIATYLISRSLRKSGMTFYDVDLLDSRRSDTTKRREFTGGLPEVTTRRDRRHTKGIAYSQERRRN